MKKILAAVSAIFFCFAFSSCNESGAAVGEGIIIDDIETEETFSEDTTAVTAAADIITETSETTTAPVSAEVHLSETSSETSLETETRTETISETEPTEVSAAETKSRAVIEGITEIRVVLSEPSGENGDIKVNAFDVSVTECEKIFGIYSTKESDVRFISKNQFEQLADELNGLGVSYAESEETYSGNHVPKQLHISLGEFYADWFDDIPTDIESNVFGIMNKYYGIGISREQRLEAIDNGRDMAVKAAVYFRSFTQKNFADTEKGLADYAGKGAVFGENKNPFDSEDFSLPDDWHGYTYVKFNEDGTDVEVINWSETEDELPREYIEPEEWQIIFIEKGVCVFSLKY